MKHFNQLFGLGLLMMLFWLPVLSHAQSLSRISSFGSNPGNLDMYLYAPSSAGAGAPLVVAMHGCTQDAAGFAAESGWSDLASKYGFYVVYPQQKSGNNSSKCFNWFENGDINRGQGEASSIRSMVSYMKSSYGVDGSSVFVTGFSAGGAMTAVMMAAYPDEFSGGAVMAGLPYKAATSLTSAFSAMSPGVNRSPSQWGSLVRNAYSSYSGPYPTLSVFHGTSDYTVSNSNLTELMEQWTNVHGTDTNPETSQGSYEGNSRITRKEYRNSGGSPVVLTFDITSMGHAVAVDPGSGDKQGGSTGGYATDVNFFAAYYAAEFWGITGGGGSPDPGAPAAPSALTASYLSASSAIALSWSDNSSDETSFSVERSLQSSGGFAEVASLSAGSTSYSDASVSAGNTYYYRVRAQSSGGYSAYSNTASAAVPGSGGGGGGETFTIEQPLAQGYLSYVSTSNSAQSFTLDRAALLKTIEVKFRTAISNSTLKVFAGNTVTDTPIYTQQGVSKGSGWQTVALSSPLSLQAGQYTFQVTNSVFSYSYTNTYSGGNIYLDTYGYTVFDAAFKLTFEASSSSARYAGPEANAAERPLYSVSSFGYNPGNLSMYLYVPANMPANAPVVVAMHGCSQTASSYANNTGWNELADRFKFYVIYPQQSSYNNGARCFNWFNYYDYTRGYGENRSIRSMVDYVKSNYSVNAGRVFATGFSAGGGMTTTMLATYPEVFSAGAVLAGVPYHAAANAYASGYAMNPGYNLSPGGWGDLVRGASNYSGPWPEVAVFHGTSDYTVNDNNLREIMEQWTNVHGTDRYADATDYSFAGNSSVTRRDYRNSRGSSVVVTYSIAGMGHDVSVDPGTGSKQGGTTGTFAADVNFFSSYYAAEFFGLTGSGYRVEPTAEEASSEMTWRKIQGGVELSLGSEYQEATIRVLDMMGREVYSRPYAGVSVVDVVPGHSREGVYFIQVSGSGGERMLKVYLD
ncbi:PHB depolymerase family esterase [Roseivirga sp. BDSF3-8]|uniref:extracellular catalytic domain type 1 short-chain-length polyhydroxyalkanoate depolymerase n=1 Tax=Roseivirga sp. BDSF3-8 TaxID=3241598 RepID=UPI003531A71D